MDKDTFSRNTKEDLSDKAMGSRPEALWEGYALRKFLMKTKDGRRSTLWAEPYLMRRLVRLTRYTKTHGVTARASRGRKSRAGLKLPAEIAENPILRAPSTDLLFKHPFLRRAFLRGTFLARGSVLSPYKGHHLEIVFYDPKDASLIKGLLETEHLKANIAARRKAHVVYIKDADDICEFLKIIGSSRSVLKYENIRVSKSLRNSVQRIVNMDRANVSRTVEASLRQTEDIKLIENHLGLNTLPKALRILSENRLLNPEMSMGELGQSLTPPISKSAVNHRFRRIAKIADKIRNSLKNL